MICDPPQEPTKPATEPLVHTGRSCALPVIPAHFARHSHRQTALYLTYGVALYVVPGVLSYASSQSGLPLPVKAALVVLLTLLAAQGLFMLGVTGHEGFHYTLHRKRFVSAGLGMVFSAAVPMLCTLGFALNHWDHHRWTNSADDPDIPVLLRYRSMLRRLLFARVDANRRYLMLTLDALRMAPSIKDRTLGMTRPQLRRLAQFNLAVQAAWLAGYAAFIWMFPLPALFIVVLPVIVAIGISGLNHYYEHEATSVELYGKARSRTAWLHTVLMCGTNYHLEHHLFPTVPCWRLPRLHRWMLDNGHYRAQPTVFEPRFFGSYASIAAASTGSQRARARYVHE
jgi:beta-carotene hydroxylase